MNILLTNIHKTNPPVNGGFYSYLLPRRETGLPMISDNITACRAVSGLSGILSTL